MSQPDTKNLLMIAYHFPPAQGSGVQRTLSFCRDLPEFGWQPEILSANPRVYSDHGPEQLTQIPPQTIVERAFALDAAKDLSIAGRYLRLTALPDRWSSWRLWAVPKAMAMIKKNRPQIIWATYPIATSLLIAQTLHKKTGIPWVADFRDPMLYNAQAEDSPTRRLFAKIEMESVMSAAKVITTTFGHRQLYREKYPDIDDNRWQVIPNGYDESMFAEAERSIPAIKHNQKKITILHSGTIYNGDENRTPQTFFSAIAKLRKNRQISSNTMQIFFRATGCDETVQSMIDSVGIGDMVQLKPTLPYGEAIKELFLVDGLLLLQGKNYNHQIPAKLFEYLRVKKPFLAITDPKGDSARVMEEAGVTTMAPMHNEKLLAEGFMQLIKNIKSQTPSQASNEHLKKLSRNKRAEELARVLDSI
ncbi:MAG: glycosyltransferase [Magnetococcales bacterium]|nr:glycosyltransferase [Magnetococcales bacterium]